MLALALRAAAPWALARGIERGALASLGLPVEVANVDLALLRGAAAVEGIVVGRAGETAASPLLRVSRLAANLSFADLLAGRVHLSELAIEGPVVRLLRRADGSVEDPLPPRPAEETPEAEPSAGGGWPIAIDRLRVASLDFELGDPGRDAPALGFALEELALFDVAFEGEDLSLGGVGVRGPKLRVERSFVLGPPSAAAPAAAASLPAAPSPAEPAPAPAPATGPRYRLERVAVERARISLLSEGRPLDVELDLTAEGVSARAGESFPLALGLRVEGGELRAEGRAGLAPLAFDGTLRWRDLPIPLFALAARPDLLPWVRSCAAEGDLSVKLRLAPGAGPAEAAEARVAGRFAVRDLSLADPQDREVALRWRALEVEVREALVPLGGGAPIRVALERVRLEAPGFRYARPTPLLDALIGGAPAADTEPPAAAAEAPAETAAPPAPESGGTPAEPGVPLELTLDAVELTGGSLAFADGTLDPPFRTAIRDLSLSARSLRWPELRVQNLRVRGVAPERAPFSLRGGLDGPRGELRFEIQRLDLPAFDSYATGAGYRLARGEASLSGTLRLQPDGYAADSELRLHDLRLDSAGAGAFERQFGTSLDLALALLRDRAGDIRLPVPVAGERESLRLGIRPIVLGALRAALVGVVSSPLKALGAALPRAGDAEVDVAAFAALPGAAELAPEEGARVAALAELLRSRPLLALALSGRAGPADRPALAEREAVRRASAGEPLPDVEGAGFLARRRLAEALRARGRGETPPLSPEDEALLARLFAATEVAPEGFASLARERAAALRERLLAEGGLDPARVSAADAAAEGAPAVELELVAHAEEVLE